MPDNQGKTDVWNDPFAGDKESFTDDENTETAVKEEPLYETPDVKPVPVTPAGKHTPRGKKKLLTPLNISLGAFLVLALAAGGGFLWKNLSSDNDYTLMSQAIPARRNAQPKMYNEPPASSQNEMPTRTNGTALIQDAMPAASTTTRQIATPSPAVSTAKLDTEIEQLRETLGDLRSEAQAVAATLRGDGMATIAKADLAALMQANASLQSQVDAAIVTIQQTKEEKEQAVKKVSEIEARYRSLSEQANKQPAPPKSTPKKPAQTVRQTRLTSEPKKQETKPAFTVVGLTDSFIVVKKGTEFKTLQIGESLDGVTLTGINPLKNRIITSDGEFSMSSST